MEAATAELVYERRGESAWLRLNRPEVLNSLTPTLVRLLRDGLARAERESGVRSVVITGTGRGFCVGTDLALVEGKQGPFDLRAFLSLVRDGLLEIESSPLPVIAAVNGVACAGGLELILACDLVVASEEARLGDGHATYGIVPGGGCTVRLPERIGATRAKQLFFGGDLLPARELMAWGLVNHVVPGAGLPAAAGAVAAMFAARSPLATARLKLLTGHAHDPSRREALDREIDLAVEHAASADMAEGLAAFAGKRAPRFGGA